MKNYDPNIINGTHTIRVTLQMWDYKGHIIQKIKGNCKGREILDFDFEYEDEFPNNDCQMEYNEEYDGFKCVLTNECGETTKFEGDAEDMNSLIVAVEIIDFKKNEDCN